MATNKVSITMKKLLIVAAAVVFSIIIIPAIIWKLVYIDKILTKGEKYGVMIGESKQEIIKRIKTDTKRIGYKAVQVGNNSKEFKVIGITELQFSSIQNYDSWVIMLDSNYSLLNIIKLNFKSDKLASIHRHKKLFELP